jgi:hypothetical protein
LQYPSNFVGLAQVQVGYSNPRVMDEPQEGIAEWASALDELNAGELFFS